VPTKEDDPAILDWGDQANTAIDPEPAAPELPEPEKITAPHRTLAEVDRAYESGREAGFSRGYVEGQNDTIRALAEVFAATQGGVDQFARAVIKRVRSKLTRI
jgi:hypothetical protein